MKKFNEPSSSEVKKYLKEFENLENGKYRLQENVLEELFKNYKTNSNKNEVMIKVAVLDSFYSINTRFFSTIGLLADNIINSKIDKRIKWYDPKLINEIAAVSFKGSQNELISFASKYCSHTSNNPDDYPNYDKNVKEMLRYFRTKNRIKKKVKKNFDFKNSQLEDYDSYRNILLNFRKCYKLEQFTLKEIDWYLWQLGKKKKAK